MNVDLRTLRSRNVWPLPSGELAVRPGAREVYTAESGRKIVAGFSVRNFATEAVFHYVVDVATSGALDCIVRIYDENFVVRQVYSTNADVEPRTVTHAVVKDQIIISSPDFPTIWGLVGGFLYRAVKVTSDNPTTTAIDVPRGICVAWASRCVIASANSLHISDPVDITGGSPRTFVAENQWPFEAQIYGLHVTPGGRLVACSTRGVMALDSSAAAAGQVPTPDWYMLTEYRCLDYQQTAHVHGRIYGLTRKGYRLIDTQETQETLLDDPYMPISIGQRICSDDYRRASRIYESDLGPLVAYDEVNAFHRVDLATGVRSWWDFSTHTNEESNVRGVLLNRMGDELILTIDAAYRIGGNFDGGEALTENGTAVAGVLYGALPIPPHLHPLVRHVTIASDTVGNLICAVRGEQQTGTPDSSAAPRSADSANQLGPVIGTDDWDDAAILYSEPQLRGLRFDWDIGTDDPTIEVGAEHPLSRIAMRAEIDFDGLDPERSTQR